MKCLEQDLALYKSTINILKKISPDIETPDYMPFCLGKRKKAWCQIVNTLTWYITQIPLIEGVRHFPSNHSQKGSKSFIYIKILGDTASESFSTNAMAMTFQEL